MASGLGLVVVVSALTWWMAYRGESRAGNSTRSTADARVGFSLEPEKKVFARYAGAQSCRECHATAFNEWKGSHHGLAERKIDPALDRVAFESPLEITTGTLVSEARTEYGRFQPHSWLHTIGFATVVALTVYVIVDIEYPRLGLIRVDEANFVLLQLRESMQPAAK